MNRRNGARLQPRFSDGRGNFWLNIIGNLICGPPGSNVGRILKATNNVNFHR